MDIRDRVIELRRVTADELRANPRNWRKHPPAQVKAMRAILEKIGFAGAALTYDDPEYGLTLIDGHLRKDQVGKMLIPVLTTDLNRQEADALLALFDPLAAMAETNEDLLKGLMAELPALDLGDVGAEIAALMKIGMEIAPAEDPGAQIDRAAELQEKWQVARGDVWLIESKTGQGVHRLMCGDSYSDEDYTRLIHGAMPDLLHTDPPYGVNIIRPKGLRSTDLPGGSKPFGATSGTSRRSSTGFDSQSRLGRVETAKIIQSNIYPVIEGDDRPFEPAFLLDKAPVIVLWGANYYADKLPSRACWIVWDKREDITRNNFADCELAWTNQNSPARIFYHLWNGLHKGSQHKERRTHPTEKPVALFAEIGKLHADKGLWVDLFSGSGAQIVAAEQTGATCYANEIEPLYVATTLQRCADMGLSIRKDEA